MIQLAGIWLALSLAVAFAPTWTWLWQLGIATTLGVVAVDALAVRVRCRPALRREVPSSLPLAAWSRVGLRVDNPSRRTLRVEVYDHHPPAGDVRGLPLRATIAPGGYVESSYRFRPAERGPARFERADALMHSPLRLWLRRVRGAQPESVRVYPDFSAIARYSLLATDNRTSQLGIRRRPRRGEGMEFHQLREYRRGDAPRQVDWKATSRVRRVISRDYQDERDQQVVFLLDCGQKMHSRDGDLAHFDHALNAILLLGHVALHQGDAVGLISFGGERRWLAPRKGVASINPLLNSVYDLSTSLAPSDYLEVARNVLARVPKRSLVVFVTNLRDEDADELSLATRLLRSRHLVLVASLRETVLDRTLEHDVTDFDQALRVAGAHDYLAQRRIAHDRVREGGVLLIDTPPAQLPVHLVNRYLDVKASGRL